MEISKNTVNWYGPAPNGMIVTNGWDPETMEPPKEWVENGLDGGKRGGFGGSSGSSNSGDDSSGGSDASSPGNDEL